MFLQHETSRPSLLVPTQLPGETSLLFVSTERLGGCGECPADTPYMPKAACMSCLEGEPSCDDVICFCCPFQDPARGLDFVQKRNQHCRDGHLAFPCLYVPSSGQQIAPDAFCANRFAKASASWLPNTRSKLASHRLACSIDGCFS